jgi:hypothetical protein
MIDFPQLNYPKEVPPLEHSERLKKSIKGMKTLFNTKKIPIDKDKFINNQTNDYGKAVQNIEEYIASLIYEFIDKRKDETLVSIFHYIHFWGGITGRAIYIRNGGFDNNFNLDTYKKIVETIIVLKQDTLCEDLIEIEKLIISMPYLGVAYGTKHLRFWSINANKNKIELPILDSIIAKKLLKKTYFAWRHYCPYVKQMQEEAKKRKVSVTAFERLLYNKFNKQ